VLSWKVLLHSGYLKGNKRKAHRSFGCPAGFLTLINLANGFVNGNSAGDPGWTSTNDAKHWVWNSGLPELAKEKTSNTRSSTLTSLYYTQFNFNAKSFLGDASNASFVFYILR
jgi:hypothetical protein